MNFFWKNDEVYYFSDEQISNGLSDGLTPLAESEILKHKTEPKSEFHTHWDEATSQWIDVRSSDEVLQDNRKNMPTILPMDFDLLLDKHGLYDAVQELIKQDRSLHIAYNRATYFSRTDPFIDQARIALGLTPEQVDEMWMS